jgi:enoyl-CoA hydratase/carnithine racemase
MNANSIEYEQHSGTAIIRLNRPHKKNALNLSMYRQLNEALDKALGEKQIISVVLTGHEDFFTTGNDIQDFVSPKSLENFKPITDFIYTLSQYPKPLIAAVNGPCVGIGTTLLLHCDLIYAGKESYFHMPFSQLGLTPEAGASYLLPALMGHQKAMQYLLLAEPFDAKTALNFGLVNEILDKQNVLSHAMNKAEILSRYSHEGVLATKMLLKKSQQKNISLTIEQELPLFFNQLQQPYSQAILNAFLKKQTQD